MTSKKKKIYITTPIYYPSGKPHIGHAYTTVLADAIARYKKAIGYDVFFQTGLDEHGEKIANVAKKQNKNIKLMLDEMANIFKSLWEQLDISYDHFIRTTDKQHEQAISKIFSSLIKKDYIYLGQWASYYCISCEENYTKSQIVKKPDGKLYCQFGHELVYKKEPSYFLKVSKYQNWIKNFLEKSKNLIQPQSRIKELLNTFVNEGLIDLSVSRTSIDWGIKVKENPKHVIYVWIDALFNYLTGLGYLSNNDKQFKKYWQNDDVQRVHLMSKEIMRFHCIYWPIMLHMLDLKLPTKIISHGWIITNQGKMSKSLGNVIDPKQYIDDFGSDALRYFLIKELNVEQDSVFNHDIFVKVYNSDLANNYGNMITRVWGMLQKYTNYKVPKISFIYLNEYDKNVIKSHQDLIDSYEKYIDNFKIKDLLVKIQSCYDTLNKYIENTKPWILFKNKQTTSLNNFLNIVFHFLVDLNILLSPVLVKSSSNFFKIFNLKSKKNKNCVAFSQYFINKDSKDRYKMYQDHCFQPKNDANNNLKIIFVRK